jgi:predicted nucleic acid-binding protein
MDNLVLDGSVAVKWFVAETHSAEALRILMDHRAKKVLFLAPDLIYAEVGNIAWKKHLFQGMTAAAAQQLVAAFRALPITVTSSAALLDDAFRLAVTHRRSVYDMLYLALSVREQCRFVTADQKLVNAVGPAFPNVVWVANWP